MSCSVASDALITDYSSLFFDYAPLGRPIAFFPYDLEEYRDQLRGFYLDYPDDLPGPVATELGELAIRGAVDAATVAYCCGIVWNTDVHEGRIRLRIFGWIQKRNGGRLLQSGASFTEAKSSSFPSVLDVSSHGRIRPRHESLDAPEVRITVIGPEEGEIPQIEFDFKVEDEVNAVHYDEKVASVYLGHQF